MKPASRAAADAEQVGEGSTQPAGRSHPPIHPSLTYTPISPNCSFSLRSSLYIILIFKTGSLYVALALLAVSMQSRLASNSQRSACLCLSALCLCLPRAEIKGTATLTQCALIILTTPFLLLCCFIPHIGFLKIYLFIYLFIFY